MDRTALNDDRLSWKAKGIMAYLLSMPDNWTFYMEELQTHATDGERAFRSGFKELKDHGYITRQPVREGQRIVRWETIVHEVPQNKKNEGDSLLCGFVHVENEDIQNVHVQSEDVQNSRLLSTDINQVLNIPSIDNNQILNKPNTNQPNNLIQQDNTLGLERDSGWVEVFNFYCKNIHPNPLPLICEKLGMMYDLYPIAELVQEALQIAVLNHAKNPIHYAEPILLRWRSQNIKTVEQARFEQRKEGRAYAINQHQPRSISEKARSQSIGDESIRNKLRNFSSQQN